MHSLTGTSSVQSVTTKVGTQVSLTAQRFTVQIPPPSQTSTTKTSKSLLTTATLGILSLHLHGTIKLWKCRVCFDSFDHLFLNKYKNTKWKTTGQYLSHHTERWCYQPIVPLVVAATPTTPAVSNVLINPSLIGSKNILITTNMASQNSSGDSLKRKHEDDEDYDAVWWKNTNPWTRCQWELVVPPFCFF